MQTEAEKERALPAQERGITSDIEYCIEHSEDAEAPLQGKWFSSPGDLGGKQGGSSPLSADHNAAQNLDEAIRNAEESFSQMLIRKIDECGLSDVECYKRAHIDRKLFSKIRSDRDYKPSRITAVSFVLALELSLEEAKEMLLKAGYALSKSNKFDIIIAFFINRQNYNFMDINEALLAFDQPLLH